MPHVFMTSTTFNIVQLEDNSQGTEENTGSPFVQPETDKTVV
jgi:hypothetical protein